jgi:hypothetical protein
MTTHEFGKMLLDGPNILVGMQPVQMYQLDNAEILPPSTFVIEAAESEEDYLAGKKYDVLIISCDNDSLKF